MSLFSTLKTMFSSDTKPTTIEKMDSEEHNGFTITPAPIPEGSQFRVNGTIEKGDKTHTFIRADILPSKEQCADEMVRKSKLMIDQIGESLFR